MTDDDVKKMIDCSIEIVMSSRGLWKMVDGEARRFQVRYLSSEASEYVVRISDFQHDIEPRDISLAVFDGVMDLINRRDRSDAKLREMAAESNISGDPVRHYNPIN